MSKSANIEIQTQKHTLIQSIVELPFQITEPDKIKEKKQKKSLFITKLFEHI